MTSERKQKIQDLLNNRQNDLTVVLENVHDPHNIAAVMRTCDAVGIMEIFVIKTKLPKRAKWGKNSSSGAFKWLKVHEYQDVDECMKVVKQKYTNILTTHLAHDSKNMYEHSFIKPTALVFGNEGLGLSQEILKYSTGNFIIPQVGIIQSLNISVACAVTLYEAYRQKKAAGHYNNAKLKPEEISNLLQYWDVHNVEL